MAKTTLTLLCMLCLVTGCVSTDFSGSAKHKSTWRIEQDTYGKYVYCQDGIDCPVRTSKTRRINSPQAKEYVPVFAEENVIARVYFAFGKSGLDRQATKTLSQTVSKLKNEKSILLRGWTDPVSGKNSKINQSLARNRALAVKKWLVTKGIDAKRITIESSPPCCNNQSATAKSPDTVRKKMRQVTIELLAGS